MEAEKFEEQLIGMSKPEVTFLKHQDMLEEALEKAKDKSVLSWWWLSIPLYIIAALLMKTFFIPNTTLVSNLHEFAGKQKYAAPLLFLTVPMLFIIINLASIRKIYFLSGNPGIAGLLRQAWFNLLMIIASVLILITYLI